MTAAAVTAIDTGEGLAARRALRDARIRGIAFAIVAVIAVLFAPSAFGVAAKFSFWIQEQGGEAAIIETTVGLLWVLAAIGSAVVAVLQLLRGAAFRWRRWLLLVIAPWIVATLAALLNGKPATMTNVFAGSLEAAAPTGDGRDGRHPFRAERHAQHRARRQDADRRIRRVVQLQPRLPRNREPAARHAGRRGLRDGITPA